jgi:hypothetical protein
MVLLPEQSGDWARRLRRDTEVNLFGTGVEGEKKKRKDLRVEKGERIQGSK